MIKNKPNKLFLFFRNIFKRITTNINVVRGRLRLLHNSICSLKESKIAEQRMKRDRNPYQVFLDWLFDILQYGVITSLALFFAGLIALTQIIPFAISIGLIEWIFIETIKHIRQSVKGEN